MLAHALFLLTGFEEAESIIIDGTRNPDPYVRNEAIHLLRLFKSLEVPRTLWQVIRDDSEGLCISSAFMLLLDYCNIMKFGDPAMFQSPLRQILFGLTGQPYHGGKAQALADLEAEIRTSAPGVANVIF